MDGYNWKAKIIMSYICSDVIKTTVFLPFESRKQRLQMHQTDLGIFTISKNAFRAFIPMIARDIIFRIITLGSFLNSLNIEHKPTLKYKLSEIRELIKESEKKGEKLNVSFFMDYSKFNIYSTFPLIFFNLVICTIVATIVTHPTDVVITKILTQTRPKYKGLIQGIGIISKEDSYKKLFFSGLSVRISFNILSAMTVLVLLDTFNNSINNFYEIEE